jgi:hypothetical protein
MTVVSSKEFETNTQKYYQLAINGNVCIKWGERLIYLSNVPVEAVYPEQPVCEDNSDLETAITGDELRKRMHRRIHEKFATRV